jgi:hypothetical protein
MNDWLLIQTLEYGSGRVEEHPIRFWVVAPQEHSNVDEWVCFVLFARTQHFAMWVAATQIELRAEMARAGLQIDEVARSSTIGSMADPGTLDR